MDRLPSSLATEQCLIASLASGASNFADVADVVAVSDFSHAHLATAFRWMTELFLANREVSMFELAETYGHLPEFRQFQDAVRGGQIEYGDVAVRYADSLRERSHFRATVAAISQLAEAARTATAYSALRDAVEGLLTASATDHRATGVRRAREIVRAISERMANPVKIVKHRTGFPTLDDMLTGGFREKHLVVIAGSTGGGKTVLAMNIAVQAAQDETPVAVFSLEMDAEELMIRCILSESRVHGAKAEEMVASLPIHVSDNPDMTSRGIWAQMKVLKARHSIGIFVIDYLQLLGDDSQNRESRERVVAGMSRRLKIAAKQLGVTVIALSQVNGDGELRESRAIEQDADVVLQVINDGTDYWLRVCKNRAGKKHGPMCLVKHAKDPNERGIPLRFRGEHFRFTEA